ncbi:hypothetical protein M422DRAFT_256242 [Sphaerobolus stellatus SS14]|uniref:Uncharacterized protein n=1 Tax=Sphaerobolus stellatus (strain SS14) TaxID=990650 RepID=A0A0C9V177_SPHS4|nr:hypothetical protein M422DRAFT_256242 [Sphaerobolus stellatus SS14]
MRERVELSPTSAYALSRDLFLDHGVRNALETFSRLVLKARSSRYLTVFPYDLFAVSGPMLIKLETDESKRTNDSDDGKLRIHKQHYMLLLALLLFLVLWIFKTCNPRVPYYDCPPLNPHWQVRSIKLKLDMDMAFDQGCVSQDLIIN